VAYETREAMIPDRRAILPKNKGHITPPRQDRAQKFTTSPKKLSLKGKPEATNHTRR